MREETREQKRPFGGKFNLHHEKSTYHCTACPNALFSDEMKFSESHCGWPEFRPRNQRRKKFCNAWINRMSAHRNCVCACSFEHLGHIFNDGITDCSMGEVLRQFFVAGIFRPQLKRRRQRAQNTLGGGCYWCIEAVFNVCGEWKKSGVRDFRAAL
ncbi:MAG: peptide-methionine (R)-S-oxide reductase [Sphingobacteriales bacterium]|nr:peptide-methionine (R)-S-oxide reductase [Sphingobacteriales bacterium]